MSQGGPSRNKGSASGNPIETLTGNSGGAVPPDASFNLNITANTTMGIDTIGTPGTNTINIVASQATTTQLGTIQLATNAEAIAGTDTNKAVTSDDLKAKLGTQTQFGLPIGAGNSAALSWTAAPTNGQLLIGSTGLTPVLGTLTAGSGISISNGAGSITISTTSGGSGTGNTVGAVTADIVTVALGGAAKTFTITARVAGFESTGPSSTGYSLMNVVRTNGAAATLVGTTVKDIIESAALAAADADIVVSANNVIVRVTGVAGLTINWSADLLQLGAP